MSDLDTHNGYMEAMVVRSLHMEGDGDFRLLTEPGRVAAFRVFTDLRAVTDDERVRLMFLFENHAMKNLLRRANKRAFPSAALKQAVTVSQRLAHGQYHHGMFAERRRQSAGFLQATTQWNTFGSFDFFVYQAVHNSMSRQSFTAFACAQEAVIRHQVERGGMGYETARAKADCTTRQLLRDLVCPPGLPPVLDPEVCTWKDGTVRKLGHEFRTSRTSRRNMPILADALEDAGCTDEAILLHCRDTDVRHLEDCWVLNLIRDGSEC